MKPEHSNIPRPENTEAYATRIPSPATLEELSRLSDAFGRGASREAPGQGVVGVPREEFERALFGLGLMRPVDLMRFLEDLPERSRPSSVEGLARSLIEARKLSRYQASAIYQGKGKILAIGPYVVLDRLGKGGMGLVFKARHRDFLEPLALKVLPPSSSKQADSVRRFRREAKLLARLEHPNLVTSHDIGEYGGVHFLVMDYVEGVNLDRIVRTNGPLPPSRAVEMLIQAARGLGAAHQRHIVHRDIKPANLILDAKGVIRVLDLGLARMLQPKEDAAPQDSDRDTNLTGTGIIMGTVDYLSPEQSKDSKRADHRSDIYSLGCTLHFLLTRQPPYPRGTTMQRLLAHHQDEIPSIRDLRPEIPPSLDDVFRRMIAKQPEHRPKSMAHVAALLESCRGTSRSGKVLLVFGDGGKPRSPSSSSVSPNTSGESPRRSVPPEWPEDPPGDSDDDMDVYELDPTAINRPSPSDEVSPLGPPSPGEEESRSGDWWTIGVAVAALVLGAAVFTAVVWSRSRTAPPTDHAPARTPPPSRSRG